jgi:hypothetical protein
MMVDNVVFTELTPEKVNDIISQLKQGKTAVEIANPNGTESKDRAYVNAAGFEHPITYPSSVFYRNDTALVLPGSLYSYITSFIYNLLLWTFLRIDRLVNTKSIFVIQSSPKWVITNKYVQHWSKL